MNDKKARELLTRYRNGLCLPEEERAIEAWVRDEIESTEWQLSPDEKIQFGKALKSRIDFARGHSSPLPAPMDLPKVRYFNFLKLAVAASIIFFVAVGYFFLNAEKRRANKINYTAIHPGGNKATLILADGRKISLSDVRSGQIAVQSGSVISKNNRGQVTYEQQDKARKVNQAGGFNTIVTPNGGQWNIKLPDGTLVWVNAGSSLKYPASFSPSARVVELSGEAYFEVSHDPSRPFSVVTADQRVKVLGTHFNISAYPGNAEAKTTLLEGRINVLTDIDHQELLLLPGEQLAVTRNGKSIKTVDAENAAAWKDGLFVFDNDPLDDVLQQLSRWYNVPFSYTDPSVRNIHFSGTIPKASGLKQVLDKMGSVGNVRFNKGKDGILVSGI